MPISFTCPHCQAEMSVDDHYGGQTGPCRQCGKAITIPVGKSPGLPSKASLTPWLLGGLAVGCLVLVALVGLLIAFILPAVSSARNAARRAKCTNQQKQLALAMLNYEATNGSFPAAFVADEDGRPMHSWRVLILPFLDDPLAQKIINEYNMDEPWDSEQNLAATSTMPEAFRCPEFAEEGDLSSSYYVVVGPDTIFPGKEAIQIRDVRDGLSRTLLTVESDDIQEHWSKPVDIEIDSLENLSSEHPHGSNVAFADGHVMCLEDITREQVNRNDGR